MNSKIARERISDVIKIDSINSLEGDFLATHVPFRKISFKQIIGGKENLSLTSEEEICKQLFLCDNVEDKHQFIIIEGSSGAGKSHFIRWINAKLKALEENNDLILLIRRSDNTLKGTIKQLLLREEIQNIENKEIIERLTKANNIIGSEEFKMSIFYKFLHKIDYDIHNNNNEMLSNAKKKNLLELLKTDKFEERLLEAGGPIERIYLKVASENTNINHDVIALFNKKDFILDIDFVEEMRYKGATRKACKMADELIQNGDDTTLATEVAEYINSFVDEVIQDCAGIEPGDFQQIFKDIRRELKRNGKGLILLIEDITAFTGINQALLNVLVTAHTGLNEEDDICRLISVVGTTSEYYSQFRDNYRDRITAEVSINDGAIGENKQDLVQFVARYLNVMSIKKNDIEMWYKNGADEGSYPVHEVMDGVDWENFVLPNGTKLNLYPFTVNSIINLYNGLTKHKTPRYILRYIIEKAVYDILDNKKMYPSFCSDFSLNRLKTNDESRIYNVVSTLYTENEVKRQESSRIKYLISYWGNNTLTSDDEESFAGLNLNIYKELNLLEFVSKFNTKPSFVPSVTPVSKTENVIEKLIKKESYIPNNNIPIKTNSQYAGTDALKKSDNKNISSKNLDDSSIISDNIEYMSDDELKISEYKKRKNDKYQDYLEKIRKWNENIEEVLIIEPNIREVIIKFIFSSINWQEEGVSMFTKKLVEDSSRTLIAIEGQERGIDNALIILERNMETFEILVVFGQYFYLGEETWDFEDSASYMYIATSWLQRKKSIFVNVVNGVTDEEKTPVYIKYSLILDVYRQILNKEFYAKSINELSTSNILKKFMPMIEKGRNGHCDSWSSLLDMLYSDKIIKENFNNNILFFKTIQGTSLNANKVIVNYTLIERVLNNIKQSNLCVDLQNVDVDIIPSKNKSREILSKILLKLDSVVNEEKSKAKEIYSNLLQSLGFDDDDEIDESDLKDVLNDAKKFYESALSYGCNISSMKDEIDKFKDKISLMLESILNIKKALKSRDRTQILLIFSSDPIYILEKLMRLFSTINNDITKVTTHLENDKKSLKSDGIWIDGKDPRFEEKKDYFMKLYGKILK
jgi:hypothetical protein